MFKSGIFVWIIFLAAPLYAKVKESPLSLSYLDLVKCFPELKNERWGSKVDLNQLKDETDKKFATLTSFLQYRQVLMKDPQGQVRRLRLAATTGSPKGGKKSKSAYALSVDKVDSKGLGVSVDIPQSHRINPSPEILAPYLSNQEILEDENSYFDTKLYGVSLSYKRNFKDVYELELNDSRLHRRVFCEDKKANGVICTCSQK